MNGARYFVLKMRWMTFRASDWGMVRARVAVFQTAGKWDRRSRGVAPGYVVPPLRGEGKSLCVEPGWCHSPASQPGHALWSESGHAPGHPQRAPAHPHNGGDSDKHHDNE